MGKNNTKKKKGRQSDGFDCKSLRAHYQNEIKEQQNETLKWTRKETLESIAQSQYQNKQRPQYKIDSINSLRHFILRERKSDDSYLLRERRKRNGFIPPTMYSSLYSSSTSSISSSQSHQKEVMEGCTHPPGWLLRYDHNTADDDTTDTADGNGTTTTTTIDKVVDNNSNSNSNRNNNSLQNLALIVFAKHIRDYQHVMGRDKLHTVLSLLSSDCLMDLSILLCSSSSSSSRGNFDFNSDYYMNDDLAMLVGSHPHVERLCLRAATTTTTRTA